MKLISFFLGLLIAPFCVAGESSASDRVTHVAILGGSRGDGKTEGFVNQNVLSRLLLQIQESHPKAVFFTGDLVLGLEAENKLEPFKSNQGSYRVEGPQLDNHGNLWKEDRFFYDSNSYRSQLDTFTTIINKTLGKNIPFYPVLGYFDSLGPDAAPIFREHFHLKNQVRPDISELAYTVVIDNALFVLICTHYYDLQTNTIISHDMNGELLQWLNGTLNKARAHYDFVFVVGNEPAFSTTAADGKVTGLDAFSLNRDVFWKILVDNGVLAYFCSGESLYDRTNRSGVWQIITGGAGAPLHKRLYDRAFYHYLQLYIPKSKEQNPRVFVYDINENLSDAFDLSSKHYPIYQLRISRSEPGLSLF